MDTAGSYTLGEVVARGLKARHGDGDEVSFVWTGDHGLRALIRAGHHDVGHEREAAAAARLAGA